MKIAKYVGDLLYDYECVVIPGLGGFLTQDKPATVNAASNLLKPPFKQVLFNAYLKANDGLLIKYVAREEGLEYKAAKEQVDRFALLCDQALKEGKRLNFHKIGYLYLNENKKISFEQDISVNYNADTFGLTGFISPAVHKPTPEEQLRKKVGTPSPVSEKMPQGLPLGDQKKEEEASSSGKRRIARAPVASSKKNVPQKILAAFFMMIILGAVVAWGILYKKIVKRYYQNYSSVIPMFYSSPNAYLIDNISHKPLSEISRSKTGLWVVSQFEKMEHRPGKERVPKKKNMESVAVKPAMKAKIEASPKKISQNEVVENKKPEKISAPSVPKIGAKSGNSGINKAALKGKKKIQNPVTGTNPVTRSRYASTGRHVFIIAGAFKYKSNAENLIHKLRLKGYPATAAGTTRSGLLRVAFAEFQNRKDAEEQLLAIRKSENPAAWIFEN